MLILTLASNGECTAMQLAEVAWPDPDDMPDMWCDCIRRRISKLRRILHPLGWQIVNRPGYGWRLKPL